ncbi:MAG: M56 family metallopeptidase [Pseudomonadales bacterium]|nr:M56 family metallopeptidase [Pseudomonadales bacterium]
MPTTREIILLAFLSGALVLICTRAFSSNPATRRWLIIQLIMIFCCAPVLLKLLSASWSIGITGAGQWMPDRTLPATAVFLTIGPGIILVILRLARIFHDRLGISRLPLQRSEHLTELTSALSHAIGCRRSIEIRSGLPPCSTSLGRATIILPPEWVHWPEQSLRSVLAHEIVHIRRRDDLWLNQTRLVSDFFWWLPWLRRLPGHFEAAIEESCDDLATGIVCNTPAYLETLYVVAATARSPSAVSAGGSDLLRRFRRFNGLRDEQVDSRGLFWSCIGALTLTTGLWTVNLTEPALRKTDDMRVVALIRSGSDSQMLAVSLQPQPWTAPELEAGTGPP